MIASVSRRDSNSSLDIATLAMRYGVSLRTLRFYESQGLLTPTRQNGKRFYSGRDCVRLEIIIKGKKLGLSLREIGALIQDAKANDECDESPVIKRMTTSQLREQIDLLHYKRREIEGSIGELERELREREST